MTNTATALKPCPCGKTPLSLHVESSEGNEPKWAHVAGSCCGSWSVEFRNNWRTIGGAESQAAATTAWNAAPRGSKP